MAYIRALTLVLPLVLGALFVAPSSALAYVTMAHQDTFNVSTLTTNFLGANQAVVQNLGSGFSGGFTSFRFTAIRTIANTTGNIYAFFFSCTNNITTDNWSGGCTSRADYISPPSTFGISIGTVASLLPVQSQATDITYTFPTPISPDPTRYYYAGISADASAPGVQIEGDTASGDYPSGKCIGYNQATCGTAAVLKFNVQGFTIGDTPYLSNISPYNGSTTAQTAVHFSFNYHAPASYSYSTYYINVKDTGLTVLVAAPTTTPTFQLTGSINSGDGTITSTVNLLNSHAYAYTVQICGPLVVVNPCTTSPTLHFAVVNTGSFSQQFYGYNAASSTASSSASFGAFSNFGSTTNGLVDSSLDAFATCGTFGSIFTLGICPILVFLFAPNSTSFQGFGNVEQTMATKVPFSYMFEVYNDFNGYTNYNDASSSPSTLINFSAMTCSGAWQGTGAFTCDPKLLAWLPSSITLFSTTSMQQAGISDTWIFYLKSAAGIAMGLSFGMFWFYRIIGFWAGVRREQTL